MRERGLSQDRVRQAQEGSVCGSAVLSPPACPSLTGNSETQLQENREKRTARTRTYEAFNPERWSRRLVFEKISSFCQRTFFFSEETLTSSEAPSAPFGVALHDGPRGKFQPIFPRNLEDSFRFLPARSAIGWSPSTRFQPSLRILSGF